MNELLQHRGPDDTGLWLDAVAGICLGHRRLSILDPSPAGHQPMVAEDGTAIVFNGEIYNFRELRHDYLPNHHFESESDTETLLSLYRQRGMECLDLLTGMFAFAVWDGGRRELLLVRDRIGKKPLYWCREGGIFAFASEIRSLLSLPWMERELDERALYHFLTFGFVPPPATLFAGISKLAPGVFLRLRAGGAGDRHLVDTASRAGAG